MCHYSYKSRTTQLWFTGTAFSIACVLATAGSHHLEINT
jgi:hypothetical protein